MPLCKDDRSDRLQPWFTATVSYLSGSILFRQKMTGSQTRIIGPSKERDEVVDQHAYTRNDNVYLVTLMRGYEVC